MNKQQRKIRELRARFVTKLTKQTKVLRASDYSGTCDKGWVDTYNKWYQFVGRNPKQSADQIRAMSISLKNKFYQWLTHDYVLFNPWGNHFDEKFAMVTFVLSKPKTMANLLNNHAQLRSSFSTMQDSVGKPGSWEEDFFLGDCAGYTHSKLNNLSVQGIDYLKNPSLGN